MKRLQVVVRRRWWLIERTILRPEHSRSPAARWRILVAAVVLLGTSVACGSSSKESYACTARCSGQEPSFYAACGVNRLQDALNKSECPAQTECKMSPNLCSWL
jgi:hypothetical protein